METIIFDQPSTAPVMQVTDGMNATTSPPPSLSQHHNIMITGCIVLAAGVSILIGMANNEPTLYGQWVLLTLSGAIVASSTAFLLNPSQEPPRVVVGRALISGVAGVVGSRFVAYKIEWLRNLIAGDQIFMFGAGFIFGLMGFVAAYAAVRTAFNRAPGLVEHHADRYFPPPEEDLPEPKDIKHARKP